jgi:hypothetical protein
VISYVWREVAACLDDDDIWSPIHLELLATVLMDYEDVGFAYTQARLHYPGQRSPLAGGLPERASQVAGRSSSAII